MRGLMTVRRLSLILSFCIFQLAGVFFQTSHALTLSRNGDTNYTITVPVDAIASEKYAAEELQKYLEIMGGAKIEIAVENKPGNGPYIHLGYGTRAQKVIPRAEYDALGAEGLIIRTSGDDLIIAGGRPRGTLYGVYAFLEDVLGCRWYMPGAEVIPRRDTIEISSLDITQTPAFEYREPFFYEAFDADWAARNRVNGSRPHLKEKHGGHITYSHFVHSANELVPPSQYFDDHPEYYTEITDPALRDKTQLCVTNPDVLKISRERVMQWMADAPDATIFSVSQNDNINYCKRDGDLEVENAEGSPAGPLLYFVNAIADQAAEKYPDKFIDTLAYQYTENAPLHVKPRDNVIIRLCHMAPSCDTHPLDKCFWNAKYVKNLKAWTRISKHVYVWHYVTNFTHYLLPFPDVKAIVHDIPFYHKNGVTGFFAQGSYQSNGGNLSELKSWLIAKMLWNPDADPMVLIRDFMNGYYGPAAPAMLDYFFALHESVKDRNAHAHLYSAPTEDFLPRESLEAMDAAFERAMDLAKDDPAAELRVRTARLSMTYLKLIAPRLFGWTKDDLVPGGAQDQLARLAEFEKELAACNVTRIDEWHSLEEYLGTMREKIEGQLK